LPSEPDTLRPGAAREVARARARTDGRSAA
jgi:hypothetical protein